MIDQAILAVKIKAAEDRLAYLRSLQVPKFETVQLPAVEPVLAPAAVVQVVEKRGPGRPRKA